MAVAAYGPWENQAWSAPVLLGSGGLWILGVVLKDGGDWIKAHTAERLDRRQSALQSAALRAVLDHLGGRLGDTGTAVAAILKGLVETAQAVVPVGDAQLTCCLLRREQDALLVGAYSDFRGPKYPSGAIALDSAVIGAVEACQTGEIAYVADTQASEHAASFLGKRYRCILAFPLMDGPLCRGVVSLDSTRPHHFDDHLDELDTHLRPIVGALHLLELDALEVS